MTVRATLLFVFLVLGGASLPAREAPRDDHAKGSDHDEGAPKVLIVTGANNHDWKHTSKLLAKVLAEKGGFEVEVTEDPASGLADDGRLADIDLFFLDYNGPRWGEPAETNFMHAVKERGVGVFVLHAANNAFNGWVDYETMVALCWRSGTGHGRFHPFDVDVDDHNHPVMARMPRLEDHPDELYHRLMHMHDADYRVLMSAHSSKESGGTGEREPMAIVRHHGKGRVFHTPLGHVWRGVPASHSSLADPQLQLLIVRGAQWAAGRECTAQPADFGISQPKDPQAPGSAKPRPHDPWVFRCTLDNRPRMLVAALAPSVWVAYDTATGGIHAAWGGGIDFTGAVYDTVHGPQPTISGLPYFTATESPELATPWVLWIAGGAKQRAYTPTFLGHRFEDGRVVLSYHIERDGLPPIRIEESPESSAADWSLVDEHPDLERRFVISGLGEGERLRIPEILFAAREGGDGMLEGAATTAGENLLLGNGESRLTYTFMLTGGVR